MTIQAVVFDWAGTTIDYGSQAPIFAFQQAFKAAGITLTVAEIRRDMGLDKAQHIRKIMALPDVQKTWQQLYHRDPTATDREQLYHDFKQRLLSELPNFAKLKPGMASVITYLTDHQLPFGTTSGYDADMLNIVLPVAAEQGYRPSVNVTSEQTKGVGRPAAAMLARACDLLAVTDRAQVLKVGDSINDILEAKNAGCLGVGLVDGSNLMGLTEAEFSALTPAEQTTARQHVSDQYHGVQADFVLTSIAELPDLITTLNQSDATQY